MRCIFIFGLCLFSFELLFLLENKHQAVDCFNRRIYSFNRGVDKILLDPSVVCYMKIMPDFFKKNYNNFFKNIFEIKDISFILFYFNFKINYYKCVRIIINSMFGLFGMYDISCVLGMISCNILYDRFIKCYKSIFLILPIIGPCTISGIFVLLISQIFNPCLYFIDDVFIYYFFEIINKKSDLMFDGNFFYNTMTDGYAFLKDVYFQNNVFFYSNAVFY